jgi:hypothetical protein
MPNKKKPGAKTPGRKAAAKKAVPAKKAAARRAAPAVGPRAAARAIAALRKAVEGVGLPGNLHAVTFTGAEAAFKEGAPCHTEDGRAGRLVLRETGNGSVWVCVPF